MTDEQTLTVFEALTQVRRGMPTIEKDQNAPAAQGGYAFAGIENYLAAANPLMDEAGLHVIPHTILSSRVTERPISNNRVMYCVYLRMQYRVYGPAGDFFEGEAEGEAADVGDKATPKAMTAARKAFLKEVLRITSKGDDPDAGDPEQTVRRNGTSDAPPDEGDWFTRHGWADQAEHDHARRVLIDSIAMLADDVRAEVKESMTNADISFARALAKAEIDTVSSWLPGDTRPPPPGSQESAPGAPESDEAPVDAESHAPTWQSISWAKDKPEARTETAWGVAVYTVDAMKLAEVTADLAAKELSTTGDGPAKRRRLAEFDAAAYDGAAVAE